ncbi:MAG TPA: GtrA family protein [Acidimicrobiales bacterium]|nr:GtrA family protein [Acidimicrobiales bacterium]
MAGALERVRRLYQTPSGRRLVRYAAVSVISTAVSFSVLGLVYGVFRWWSEAPSAAFANIVASVPAYTLNRRWSWGKSGRSHVFKEVVPFWTMTVIGIVLSTLSATGAHHFSNDHHLHHLARTVVVEGANTGSFAVLWVVKFLVLNRLFRVHPVAEMESQAETELFMEEAVEIEGAEP